MDRTAGQLGSRCDHEAFNTLTLNLAVEIAEGTRSVKEARELHAQTAAAYVMGRDAPYAERLLFTPAPDDAADPDASTIAPAMVEQTLEKVKDAFGAGEPPGVIPDNARRHDGRCRHRPNTTERGPA